MDAILAIKITDGVPSIDADLSSPGLTLETMEAAIGFLQRMVTTNVFRHALKMEQAAAVAQMQAAQTGLVIPDANNTGLIRGLR